MDRWHAATPEQLLAVATQHSPFWVSLVLVIAMGYEAARVIWLAVPAPAPAPWAPPARIARADLSRNEPSGGSAEIVAAHIFGRFDATAQPGNASANAPETNLKLQLLGAVSTADEHFAHAIIADGSGAQKVYFLKDTVPGGAILQSIQEDRVILNRGGALEALLLPRDSQPSGAPVPRLDAATRLAPPSVQEVVTQNGNNLLLTVIRPQPYMPNGEMKGYRVYPGRNREQFTALGLQPGDLVTQINGMALNNPNQAMEMFRGLGDTTQAQLGVERDGKVQTITVDTSQLAAAGGATK